MLRRFVSSNCRLFCHFFPHLVVLSGLALLLSSSCFAAEEKPLPPKILADFTSAQSVEAVKFSPIQSETKVSDSPLGKGLGITTQAEASWPGVPVEPKKGKWDLSGYYAVEADILNPQKKGVRVLLSVNNPGADGRNHCNTESLNVPAGEKATVVVPFGTWHGNTGHPLNLKEIVSIQVFLDKAGESREFLVSQVRAVPFDRGEMKAIYDDSFFKELKPIFGRGVNLGNALDAPKEGDWGVVLKEEYFEKIAKAGFQSVRIPVRWSAHAAAEAPYKIDPKFFDRVDWAIRQSLERKLVPLVNMHHFEELVKKPDENREKFVEIWRQIAEHYKDYPAELAFELLNEPEGNLTAEKWNSMLAETLEVVRKSNPTREIVIGPVAWNGINELPSLKLPEKDRHLIVTVHYYNPFHFTHQGAEWAGAESKQWLGTKWTGTLEERRAVMLDLNKAITWAVKNRRPILLGEFGSYDKGDLDSRARWTKFVADEAVKRKMDFAYWEFCASFGVYDPKRNEWRQPLLDALIPSEKQ